MKINKMPRYIGIIIFFGLLMILVSSSISKDIRTKIYTFSFDVNSKYPENMTYINHFLLFYDFSLKKGHINFSIDNYNPINYFHIEFPSIIDNKTYRIITDNPVIKLESDVRRHESIDEKYSEIILSGFDENIQRLFVSVYFDMDIKPKGFFQLYHNNKRMMIYDVSYGINFILGKKYECRDICVELLQGLEKDIRTSNEDIKLEFKDPENDNFRFRIDTFNKQNIFWKDLLFGLGISFLSSGIVLFLEYKHMYRK